MQLKIGQYFILLMLFLSVCCCDNYYFYKIENIKEKEFFIDTQFEELKTFFQNILGKGNQNIKNINKQDAFSIKYIEYKNISVEQV